MVASTMSIIVSLLFFPALLMLFGKDRPYRELSFIDRQFGGSTPLDVVYTIDPKDLDELWFLTP